MKIFRYLRPVVFIGIFLGATPCLQAESKLVDYLRDSGIRTMELDYRRILKSSTKSKEDLDKYYNHQYDEWISSSGIDPNSASGATMARQHRELLDKAKITEINGSETIYRCKVTFGSDGVLMEYSEKFHQDETLGMVLENPSWDFLSPTGLIECYLGTKIITRRPGDNPRACILGNMLHDLGFLGQTELVKSKYSFDGYPVVTEGDGRLTLKKPMSNDVLFQLACEPAKEVNALAGFKIEFKDQQQVRDQVETYSFKNYKQLNHSSIATRVEYSFQNSQYARGAEINILSWKQDSKASNSLAPITLPSFGFVWVSDIRSGKDLTYPAFQQLPSDEQVQEFRNDPAKLREHEKKLQEHERESNYRLAPNQSK